MNLLGESTTLRLPEPALSVAGVKEVLSHYGFEMTGLDVGVGLARNANSGALSRIHQDNKRLISSLRHDGASILEGELRFEDGKITEKMVDVKCALRLVDLARMNEEDRPRAIVVFSRDLDLYPAAEQATAHGVPTYIMSGDATYTRHRHHLLFTPTTYSLLSDTEVHLSFGDTEIAKLVRDPGPHQWKIEEPIHLLGVAGRILSHESGVRGFASEVDVEGRAIRDEITLYIADVTFDQEFPFPYCTSSDSFDVGRPWLVETEVIRRKDSSRIEIELGGETVRVRCPVGIGTPGQRVLLRAQGGLYKQQAAARLVGPLETADSRAIESAHLKLGRPIVVQAESLSSGGQAMTAVTRDGDRYPLKSALGVRPRLGKWYAAAPSPTATGSVELELVSTELRQH